MACGRVFPIDVAVVAINFADGIDIGQKVTSSRKAPQDFDLQIVLRIVDADAIVLRKALQQVDTLLHRAIPGLASLIFKRRITVSTPFREEYGTRVFTAEYNASRFLHHGPLAQRLEQRTHNASEAILHEFPSSRHQTLMGRAELGFQSAGVILVLIARSGGVV